MREFREKIQEHPDLIYTYSKDHIGLTIDPYNQDDEAKREKKLSETKMYAKEKFSSLLVRTKDERMKLLNKPSDEDIK